MAGDKYIPTVYLLRNIDKEYLCLRGVTDIDNLTLRKITTAARGLIGNREDVYLSIDVRDAKTFDTREEVEKAQNLFKKHGEKFAGIIWKVQFYKQ